MQKIMMSEREKRNAQRAYDAAVQGMVLLKNNHALPIAQSGKVALMGLGAVRTIRGGAGSGDPFNGGLSGGGKTDIDQSPRYHIHILDAFENAGYEVLGAQVLRDYAVGYDHEKNKQTENPLSIFSYPDMVLTDESIKEMTKNNEIGIYVLSRNAGEGTDRKMLQSDDIGDYQLCEREIENLRKVKAAFNKSILIINAGGTVDVNPAVDIGIDAILFMGQAGQEGGRAVVDVLNGTVNPSGKLTSTWAKKYADYPASKTFALNDQNADLEKYEEGIYVGYRYFDGFGIEPLYEFGYGLSYTQFNISFNEAALKEESIHITFSVSNIGKCKGKEVIQVYFSAPECELEMPVQELIAFKKTKELAIGETQTLNLSFPIAELASFDEKKEAYILSKGDYHFFIGNSSRNTTAAFTLHIPQTFITSQVRTEYALCESMEEITRRGRQPYRLPGTENCLIRLTVNTVTKEDNRSPYHDETVTTYTTDRNYTPIMPYEKVTYTKKRDIRLMDVLQGDASLTELVAQMSAEQLAALNCGTGWGVADDLNPMVGGSSQSVPGAAGETTHILEEPFGIPSMIVADGPGGIRIAQEFEATDIKTGEKITVNHFCTAWPVGTLLAQSFDIEVLEMVGKGLAEEMEELDIAIVLGPGMNIMRDPLCGRNFEYFSEDPRLTGKLAAAITKGIQSRPGVGACIKHYAANNQETNRNHVDTWIGQRTLREIYLKGYEIAVKEAQPMSIMTSYNLINGIPTADSYDLCTDIARGEWGFKGLIMTDWNGGSSTPSISMHAGNDLIMPGGFFRSQNILLAMFTLPPEFDERGQVRMVKPTEFLPIYSAMWNSFTPNANGSDTAVAIISEKHFAEVKDGLIWVDGEPIYTYASDFQELIRERENFKPFSIPLTTEVASLSEDGKQLTYKGTLNRSKTICLGDLQRCAVNNIKVIMRSNAMKRLDPDVVLACWE